MKLKKIIIFYPSFERGGVELILINLINFFLKKKIKVVLISSNFKHKYIIKNNLYPQNSVFIDYYLKYGLKTFNFKSKINCNTNESIKSKFKDRMKRKNDLAVLDKINSIDIFYEKKRINFYSLFICIYTIYFWSFDVYMTLKKQGEQKIANNFFKAITSYKRKSLILISMFLVFLKHIF